MQRARLPGLNASMAVVALAALSIAAPDVHAQDARPPAGGGRGPAPSAATNIPRDAQGHPDLSGLWVSSATGRVTAAAGGNAPRAAGGAAAPARPRRAPPVIPYKPEYQAKYDAIIAARAKGDVVADPTANCLPQGMPRLLSGNPYPWEVIQTPKQINITAEWEEQTLRIYLDAKAPDPDDLDPTFNGFTTGHWNGDVLEFRTVGLRDDTVLNNTGAPHSDAMTIDGQIRMLDKDTIGVTMLVNDPKAFTQPYRMNSQWHRAIPGTRIMEYVCVENNRNVIDASGRTTAK